MRKVLVTLAFLLASNFAHAQFFNGTANRIVKGAGAPSSSLCQTSVDVGKVYVRSNAGATNASFYVCANTAVATYSWDGPMGGGGGGSSSQIACTAVNWTGTVSVNWNTAGPAGVACNYLVATLTGNTTVSGFSNGPSNVYVEIKMNGTPRTLAWGGTIGTNIAACPASLIASSVTLQNFLFDGTNWDSNGCVSTDPSVLNFLSSTTGNDTYAGTLSGPLAALSNGVTVILKADTANTGPATLNVTGLGGSALGAISILRQDGNALSNNDITANQPITLVYNSTGPAWNIQGGSGSAGSSSGIVDRTFGVVCGGSTTLAGSIQTLAGFTLTSCYGGGNNNLSAAQMQPSAGTGSFAIALAIPPDWDGTEPKLYVNYGARSATSGTVIFTPNTSCSKTDGTIGGDTAFLGNTAFSTQTMNATGDVDWSNVIQLTQVTSGNSCVVNGLLKIKVALTGTATGNIDLYTLTIRIKTTNTF